jgi:hypothetical protein
VKLCRFRLPEFEFPTHPVGRGVVPFSNSHLAMLL